MGFVNTFNGVDINILPAWLYSKGEDIKIGIADTGTDYNHTDLQKNINLSLAYNFTHRMSNIYPHNENLASFTSARAGHGTHIAGIIGAEADNGYGIAGVAPASTIVPLKVMGTRLSDSDAYTCSIAAFVKSIEYALKNNIKIINCSFGGYSPSMAEKEAMLNAESILFVIVAGNDGNDLSVKPEYPACYYLDNSIVVTAIDVNGELSSYANYGGPTAIAAPGDNILSTYPDNDYVYSGGTSMSAPFVSAIAALVWSKNPNLKPISVKGKLISTSNVTLLATLEGKVSSGGMINAFKAVTSNQSVDVGECKDKLLRWMWHLVP